MSEKLFDIDADLQQAIEDVELFNHICSEASALMHEHPELNREWLLNKVLLKMGSNKAFLDRMNVERNQVFADYIRPFSPPKKQ